MIDPESFLLGVLAALIVVGIMIVGIMIVVAVYHERRDRDTDVSPTSLMRDRP